MSSLVAIVGRPNVGKSTLFNRIAGRKLALIEGVPGVTRDRLYADAVWSGRRFTVIDTGGLVSGKEDPLLGQIHSQAQAAIDESDVVLFVLDARAGLNAGDEQIAKQLRKSAKPVIAVVNKVDGQAELPLASEFYRLGFADTVDISADHARNIGTLLDLVVAVLPPVRSLAAEDGSEDPVRVAIVGRPNVGKSSLVNALLGKDRLIASQKPGTTRDPVDAKLTLGQTPFILTDTAGIRRRKSLAERVEQLSVLAAIRTMERREGIGTAAGRQQVGPPGRHTREGVSGRAQASLAFRCLRAGGVYLRFDRCQGGKGAYRGGRVAGPATLSGSHASAESSLAGSHRCASAAACGRAATAA